MKFLIENEKIEKQAIISLRRSGNDGVYVCANGTPILLISKEGYIINAALYNPAEVEKMGFLIREDDEGNKCLEISTKLFSACGPIF